MCRNLLHKLSYLNAIFASILGYLNPAVNNPALILSWCVKVSDIGRSENQPIWSDKVGNSMEITPLSMLHFPLPKLAAMEEKERPWE